MPARVPKHVAFHEAVLARTVDLYRQGLSLAAVGERMNVTPQQVRNRLVQAGEPRRSRGRARATS